MSRLYSLLSILTVLCLAAAGDNAWAESLETNSPSSEPSSTIHLASLEWPPYAGAELPGQGASIAVVRAALAAEGYELDVDFMPWTEVVALGQDSSSRIHGYLPGYRAAHLDNAYVFSRSIGNSPLGFVERKSAPVAWTRLEDLRGLKIGVVRGYANGSLFDAQVAAGSLDIAAARDDARNIRLVTRGRLPLAVIDRRVLSYLMHHDSGLRDARHVVQLNPRLLDTLDLHVVLRRSPEGERVRKLIDSGLRRIDAAAIRAPYFKDS